MNRGEKIWGIVPAAGRGRRMRADRPKQYLPVGGRRVIEHSLRALCRCESVAGVVVGIAADDSWWAAQPFAHAKITAISEGGETRAQTVLHALQKIMRSRKGSPRASVTDWALVHDAARPCIRAADIEKVIAAARANGYGAVLAVKLADALKQQRGDAAATAVAANDCWRALTPQMFRCGALRDALQKSLAEGVAPPDEAAAMELLGGRATLVAGHPANIKITAPADLELAARWLQGAPPAAEIRVGSGYDAHPLTAGRALILGGVTIPWRAGLAGHSDGDVLLHALCDACLGAAGLGDLGQYFPSTEARYKDADSRDLLRQVARMLAANGWRIVNVDCTLIAQRPKLSPYVPQMRGHIAADLDMPGDAVNLKSTTTDGLGFCGREQGIAASATVLVTRD